MGQCAWFKRSVTTRDGFFGDLLHTGVIVSISSPSKWFVTSVLVLRMEETRINCGFRWKKKKKKKLYGGKRWCSSEKKKSYMVVVMPRP